MTEEIAKWKKDSETLAAWQRWIYLESEAAKMRSVTGGGFGVDEEQLGRAHALIEALDKLKTL